MKKVYAIPSSIEYHSPSGRRSPLPRCIFQILHRKTTDRSGVQLWLFVCTFTSHRSALPRFAVARAINQEITRFSRIFRSCFPVFFRGRAWAFFGFGASPSAEGFRKRGWKAECRTRNLASRGRMRNTIRAIEYATKMCRVRPANRLGELHWKLKRTPARDVSTVPQAPPRRMAMSREYHGKHG